MTVFVIQGVDGWFLSRQGWTPSIRRARTFASMTEAELCVLSNGLEPSKVVPIDAADAPADPSYQAPEAAR